MPNNTHGGRRSGAGPKRKLVQPVRVSLVIEQADLDRLKATYGRKWQEVIRKLIAERE